VAVQNFFIIGLTAWAWVVSATPRPLYPRERPGCVLCVLVPLMSGTQARLHHNFAAPLLPDICLVCCSEAKSVCICCDQKCDKRYTHYLCFLVLRILTRVAVTPCSPVGATILPLCSGYLPIRSVCVALCNRTVTFTVFAID